MTFLDKQPPWNKIDIVDNSSLSLLGYLAQSPGDALAERDAGNLLILEREFAAGPAEYRYSFLRIPGEVNKGVRITWRRKRNDEIVTFTNGTNTCTSVNHNLQVSSLVTFTTTNTLPAELSTGVDYFARDIAGDDFKVSIALTSGAVPFGDDGTGTHTAVGAMSIWTIYAIESGEMRPAYYFPFTPDSESGAGDSDNEDTGIRYHSGITDIAADHVSWVVPAGAAGHDRMVIHYVQVDGAGGIDIRQNSSSIGVLPMPGGGTDYLAEGTVSLSTALVQGQTIRVTTDEEANQIRISTITSYSSTGDVDSTSHRIMVGSLTAIHSAGSSMELAYSIAKTGGDSAQWTGGYAHQGGSDSTQIDMTESFDVDGSWTIAQGYKMGLIEWTRTSTIRYDTDPTDLATLTEMYTLSGDLISFKHAITASQALISTALYPSQFAVPSASQTWHCLPWYTYDLSAVSGESIDGMAGVNSCALSVGLSNFVPMMVAFQASRPIERLFIATSAKNKVYWALNAAEGMANAEVLRGGWSYCVRYKPE